MSFTHNGHSVNVRLTKATFLALKQKAKDDHTSMSCIMRRALEHSGELPSGSKSKDKKAAKR